MPKGWRLQSNEFSSVYLKIFDSEYKIYIDQTFNLTFTKSYKLFFELIFFVNSEILGLHS